MCDNMNNKITEKEEMINYLNNIISNYQKKVTSQDTSLMKSKKDFKRNIFIFISLLFLGTIIALIFYDTFLMTAVYIISVPLVTFSLLGLPVTIFTELFTRREDKKIMIEYENILNTAKKRKKYETDLLEKMSKQRKDIHINKMSLDKSNSKPILKSNSLLGICGDTQELRIAPTEERKGLIYQKPKLSFDKKELADDELETYTYNIRPLLKIKQKGTLAKFLRDSYNVSEQKSLTMYDALLEDEISSNLDLPNEVPILEAIEITSKK